MILPLRLLETSSDVRGDVLFGRSSLILKSAPDTKMSPLDEVRSNSLGNRSPFIKQAIVPTQLSDK